MAPFTFRFESLLQHRVAQEDQAQRDLALLLRQRMILQNQLTQMQQTISQSKRQLASGLVGRVDLDGVSRFAHFSNHSALRAHQFVSKLAALEKQVDERRSALLEATRARKAVELLRDRQFAQWRQHVQRREQLELDELGARPFAAAWMEASA